MSIDIGKAITYITEDERWMTKLGIAALIFLASTFLIIPFPLLIGYQIAIMRRVMAGDKRPLPEWDDFGKLFMDGLYVCIALLVYTAPLWILMCVGMSTIIFPALGGGNEDLTAILGGITLVSWGLISCVALILWAILFFIIPSVMIQYARTDDFGSCFRFGEIMAIARANLVNIIAVAAINLVGNFAMQIVASMLFATFCLAIVAIPLIWIGTVWLLAVSAHLYGQIAAMSSPKAAAAY
jgi:hypothetical protein